MAIIYKTKSLTEGNEVELCECNHKPGYTHLVRVGGIIKAYANNIRDAYRLYNEFAR